MSRAITPSDYQYFKKRCAYWIDKLGLKGWSVYYGKGKSDDSFAWVDLNSTARSALISVADKHPDWCLINKRRQIDSSALHECLELLLVDLKGEERDKHTAIRTLENLLIDKGRQ